MAAYSHIYLYIQHICIQMERTMALQCIYGQEANAHYTKLIQLRYNNTQLPCGGLQHQPSYFAMW